MNMGFSPYPVGLECKSRQRSGFNKFTQLAQRSRENLLTVDYSFTYKYRSVNLHILPN